MSVLGGLPLGSGGSGSCLDDGGLDDRCLSLWGVLSL